MKPHATTVTRWRALKIPDGQRVATTWPAVFRALAVARPLGLAWNPKRERQEPDKERLRGWSAATFAGDYRANRACERLFAVVLDFDGGSSLARVAWHWRNFYGCLHTSPSHLFDPGVEKFRLVLPLARAVTPAEYAKLWAWSAARSAARGAAVDPSAKNCSRLWYVPAALPGAAFETRVLDGRALDVETVLAYLDREEKRRRARVPPPRFYSASATRAERYGAGALRAACREIREAVEGTRAATLTRNAYGIGRLIGTARIDPEAAVNALREAAIDAGLSVDEADAAARGGVARGEANPRDLPATDARR